MADKAIYSVDTVASVADSDKVYVNTGDNIRQVSKGELLKDTVGVNGSKNLWDEVWESGSILSNGAPYPSASQIRSANFIKVKPSTVYRILVPSGRLDIVQYNANKEFVKINYLQASANLTMEASTAYVRFCESAAYGATYKHDIAIIEGTSGTYQPYFKSNAQLTADQQDVLDLKMLGWTVPAEMPIKNYEAEGKFHQRVGRVDMGSLNWAGYQFNSEVYAFYVNISDKKPSSPNCYQSAYAVHNVIPQYLNDKEMTYTGNPTYIYIRDDSYSKTDNAASFKAAMAGKYLYYELDTEIVTPIDGNEIATRIIKALANNGITV